MIIQNWSEVLIVLFSQAFWHTIDCMLAAKCACLCHGALFAQLLYWAWTNLHKRLCWEGHFVVLFWFKDATCGKVPAVFVMKVLMLRADGLRVGAMGGNWVLPRRTFLESKLVRSSCCIKLVCLKVSLYRLSWVTLQLQASNFAFCMPCDKLFSYFITSRLNHVFCCISIVAFCW